MTPRLFLGLLITVLWVSPSIAAPIPFTSESAYNAATGAQLFLIDFNGLPVGSGTGDFPGQVDFGSPEAADPSTVFFNSGAMTDMGSTVATNFVGPVGGVFASPVRAFGLVFSSSGSPQTVELYDSSNVLFGSLVTNPGGFFGLVSDTPIASFVIRNGLFSPGNRDRFFVDDFRVSAVPEPSSVLLFGFGLVGLMRVRSRLFRWKG